MFQCVKIWRHICPTHIGKHQTITIANYVCKSYDVTYFMSYQP